MCVQSTTLTLAQIFKCVLRDYPPGCSGSFCTVSRNVDYVILMPGKVIICMIGGVGAAKVKQANYRSESIVKQAKYRSGSIVW